MDKRVRYQHRMLLYTYPVAGLVGSVPSEQDQRHRL